MVLTTRPTSCRTELSRSTVPICPRKYFETTMLVACCDQKRGISTSRCSKTTWPFSLPMTADRSSQSTSSNGSTPGRVKYRGNSSPVTVVRSTDSSDDTRGAVIASWAALVCIISLHPKKTARSYAPGRGATSHKFVTWRDQAVVAGLTVSSIRTGCWDHPAFAWPRATSTDYAPQGFRLSSRNYQILWLVLRALARYREFTPNFQKPQAVVTRARCNGLVKPKNNVGLARRRATSVMLESPLARSPREPGPIVAARRAAGEHRQVLVH